MDSLSHRVHREPTAVRKLKLQGKHLMAIKSEWLSHTIRIFCCVVNFYHAFSSLQIAQ